MAQTPDTYVRIMDKYAAYKNAVAVAAAALQAVKDTGTELYNDTSYAATFGTISGYTTHLTNRKNAINTFIASFPTEPTGTF